MTEGMGRRLADAIDEAVAELGITTACSGGDCVVVTELGDGSVGLHSTRRPHERITVDADEWAAFVHDVKAGKYDEKEDEDMSIRGASDPRKAQERARKQIELILKNQAKTGDQTVKVRRPKS
jgi:hypothetical protein